MTTQITLFTISEIIVADFLKWIFKIDPKIFHKQKNIIQLSIWAIWLVTILLGIVIGVIGKIFERIQHIKYRIIKINSILKDINNNETKKNMK